MARLCLLAALSTSLLTGCVTRPQPLYYWGNYQTLVYGHLKGDKGAEEQIQRLEEVREYALAQGKPLPPGFQAHLAMLYGQIGKMDRLMANLEAEKKQFPESTVFMEFLLKKFKP